MESLLHNCDNVVCCVITAVLVLLADRFGLLSKVLGQDADTRAVLDALKRIKQEQKQAEDLAKVQALLGGDKGTKPPAQP